MADSHSAVTATPRLPVSVSRRALPAMSASPSFSSSSHTSRFCAWLWMVWFAAHRNGAAADAVAARSGTGMAPRQNMLTVNSARIAAR